MKDWPVISRHRGKPVVESAGSTRRLIARVRLPKGSVGVSELRCMFCDVKFVSLKDWMAHRVGKAGSRRCMSAEDMTEAKIAFFQRPHRVDYDEEARIASLKGLIDDTERSEHHQGDGTRPHRDLTVH